MTGWRIDNLAGMDYTIKYRLGPMNGIFDAVSRYPFFRPKRLTRVGTENALDVLLEALPDRCKDDSETMWFWAARDTLQSVDRVRRWRGGGKYLTRAPKSAGDDLSWQFAIAIPRSDNATNTCREIFKSKRPACTVS